MSKFLKFEKYGNNYLILNKATVINEVSDLIDCDCLGIISYYERWHKYVFTATSDEYVFDAECLQDIIKFMESLK